MRDYEKRLHSVALKKIRIPEYAQNYVLTVNGEAVKYASEEPEYRDVSITAVPYAYWNNRGEGEMSVWIKAWN